MTTKVVKIDNAVRMVTGKLAPYLDVDWTAYSFDELKTLLVHVIRFEIEHNYRRHKDYKDKVGANIEVINSGHTLRVVSVGDELLVVQDGEFTK
ncbi:MULTISPECIES: hypothetical protein [unclassified Moraxella]|uniref:hypothetical protein n=1 Tax=unclassified Moraxella TaxID=2685852 RepID=UPI003AF71BCD